MLFKGSSRDYIFVFLLVNFGSIQLYLMAENAICLCNPGTIPLYKAVAPSFLTMDTKVPS